MNRARAALAAALLLALLAADQPARAQELVADLSDHLIAIDSEFTGTDLLVFGAIEGDGDVVVAALGRGGRAALTGAHERATMALPQETWICAHWPDALAARAPIQHRCRSRWSQGWWHRHQHRPHRPPPHQSHSLRVVQLQECAG